MIDIRLGDCFELLPTLPDQSFDAVIIDPPYAVNLGVAWDQPVDIARVTAEAKRLGREFYAFFGQMPTIADWHHAAIAQGLKFLDHITWVKRTMVGGGKADRLNRSHEDIYLYSISGRKDYYCVKKPYSDIKVDGLMFDTISLSGIQRHITRLEQALREGKDPTLTYKFGRSHPTHDRKRKTHTSSLCLDANFTNVWSFLPESQKTFNHGGKFHPTMKPVLLCERLVELLTPSGGRVLDCFSGSGTTAIACLHTGRECLCIERDPDYWRLSNDRLQNDHFQRELTFDAPDENAYEELPN